MFTKQPLGVFRIYLPPKSACPVQSASLNDPLQLTGTPTTIRLDKPPLPKLGQHDIHHPPQPLFPLIRNPIRRVIRMTPRDRDIDHLLGPKRSDGEVPSVPGELVAEFDDPAGLTGAGIGYETWFKAKALAVQG